MALCLNVETFHKITDIYKFLNKFGTCIDYEEDSQMNIKNRIVIGKVYKKFPVCNDKKLGDCLVMEMKKAYPEKCFIKGEKIFRLIAGGEIVNQISSIEIKSFLAILKPGVVYVGNSKQPSLTVGPSRCLVWCIPKLAEPDSELLVEPCEREIRKFPEKCDENSAVEGSKNYQKQREATSFKERFQFNGSGPSGTHKKQLLEHNVNYDEETNSELMDEPSLSEVSHFPSEQYESNRACEIPESSQKQCERKRLQLHYGVGSSGKEIQKLSKHNMDYDKRTELIEPTRRILRNDESLCTNSNSRRRCQSIFPKWVSSTPSKSCCKNVQREVLEKRNFLKPLDGITPTESRLIRDDQCCCNLVQKSACASHSSTSNYICKRNKLEENCSCMKYGERFAHVCSKNRNVYQSCCNTTQSYHDRLCHRGSVVCCQHSVSQQCNLHTQPFRGQIKESNLSLISEDVENSNLIKKKRLEKWLRDQKCSNLNPQKIEVEEISSLIEGDSNKQVFNKIKTVPKKSILRDKCLSPEYKKTTPNDKKLENDNYQFKTFISPEGLEKRDHKKRKLLYIDSDCSDVFFGKKNWKDSKSVELNSKKGKSETVKENMNTPPRIDTTGTSQNISSPESILPVKRFVHKKIKPLSSDSSRSTNPNSDSKTTNKNKHVSSPNKNCAISEQGKCLSEIDATLQTEQVDNCLETDNELIALEESTNLSQEKNNLEIKKKTKLLVKDVSVSSKNKQSSQESVSYQDTSQQIIRENEEVGIEQNVMNQITKDLNDKKSVKITLRENNGKVHSTVSLLDNDKSSLFSNSHSDDKSSNNENATTVNEVQGSTSICPASSSSQVYYDALGNIENNSQVASQISHLSHIFNFPNCYNKLSCDENFESLEDLLKVGEIVKIKVFLIGISPDVSVLQPLRLIKGECIDGCKGQFTLSYRHKLVYKKCKYCKMTAHHECPLCENNLDHQVLLCLRFSFDLLLLYGKEIIKVSVDGKKAEKFLGCTLRHYLNLVPVSSDIINKLNKVKLFAPPEDWSSVIQLQISFKVINKDSLQLTDTYFTDSLIRNGNFIMESDL